MNLSKEESLNNKSGFPNIIINNRQLREPTLQSINALEEGNSPPKIFVQQGNLVGIHEMEDGSPSIISFDENSLRIELTECANFLYEGQGSEYRNVYPPKDICNSVLSSKQWPFPNLKGLVELPTLRPDGSLIDIQGFDAATGLLYVPNSDFKTSQIKSKPSKDDAVQALKYLTTELLNDFPFVDAASKANAVGLMVTHVVRELIDNCIPLCAISATSIASGKSLFSSLNSVIASGRPGVMQAMPAREEELQKLLLSSLIAGTRLVIFDNVDEKISSPTLSSVLTSQLFSGRILGRSAMVEVPVSSIFIINGNNLTIAGDLPRRAFWVRIDTGTSNPWSRSKFQHPNLILWALKNRGKIVASLLTLARAWVEAGQPLFKGVSIPSYNNWVEVIGGILEFCGVCDFIANYTEMYDRADEDNAQWEPFLIEWREHFGAEYQLISTLYEQIKPDKDYWKPLAELLPEYLKVEIEVAFPNAVKRKIGKEFKKIEGQRFGNGKFRLIRSEKKDKKYGAFRWRVKWGE
jgi:hypothetical protein